MPGALDKKYPIIDSNPPGTWKIHLQLVVSMDNGMIFQIWAKEMDENGYSMYVISEGLPQYTTIYIVLY